MIKSKVDKSFIELHIKPILEALVMQIVFPPVIQRGNRFYSTEDLVQVMNLLCLEPVVTPLSLLMLAELLKRCIKMSKMGNLSSVSFLPLRLVGPSVISVTIGLLSLQIIFYY